MHFSKHLNSLNIEHFLQEDDLFRQDTYFLRLPKTKVQAEVKFKTENMICAGLPHFLAVFDYLGADIKNIEYQAIEGTTVNSKSKFSFELDFASALTGERVALNLLQHASSIASFTHQLVQKVQKKKLPLKILDTRKTTPGLRSLEKYAVRIGGGFNHRFGQTDCFMIKDNHKSFFGGLRPAFDYFLQIGSFYTPIIVEIHNEDELREAIDLNIKHVMLDNFSPAAIKKAVKIKPNTMTYEISGGINLTNIELYLLEGVDAISMGAITYAAPQVDVSFKYR